MIKRCKIMKHGKLLGVYFLLLLLFLTAIMRHSKVIGMFHEILHMAFVSKAPVDFDFHIVGVQRAIIGFDEYGSVLMSWCAKIGIS